MSRLLPQLYLSTIQPAMSIRSRGRSVVITSSVEPEDTATPTHPFTPPPQRRSLCLNAHELSTSLPNSPMLRRRKTLALPNIPQQVRSQLLSQLTQVIVVVTVYSCSHFSMWLLGMFCACFITAAHNMTLPTTRQRMVQAIYIHSTRSHIATRNTRACHREGLRRKATCMLFRLPALTALTDSCVVPAPGPLQHDMCKHSCI